MNKMKDVANLLGVKLNKRFKISDKKNKLYWITEEGLMCNDRCGTLVSHDVLILLIQGTIKIIKQYWKPDINQEFYYIGADGVIYKTYYGPKSSTLLNVAIGNCYPTREEITQEEVTKFYSFFNKIRKGVSFELKEKEEESYEE